MSKCLNFLIKKSQNIYKKYFFKITYILVLWNFKIKKKYWKASIIPYQNISLYFLWLKFYQFIYIIKLNRTKFIKIAFTQSKLELWNPHSTSQKLKIMTLTKNLEFRRSLVFYKVLSYILGLRRPNLILHYILRRILCLL